MSHWQDYVERYRGEFADIACNRHAEIERGKVREYIEAQEKLDDAVRELSTRLRIK